MRMLFFLLEHKVLKVLNKFEEINFKSFSSLANCLDFIKAEANTLDKITSEVIIDFFEQQLSTNYYPRASNGIICADEDGISNNEEWQEGKVSIVLDTKEIAFDVMWVVDKDEIEDEDFEIKEDGIYYKCWNNSKIKLDNETLSGLIDPYIFSYSEFEEFAKLLFKHYNDNSFKFLLNENYIVNMYE